MPAPLCEMRGICKSFGGNLVLDQVDLSLWPGEVHVLVGENGAGKSTLMKILNGVYTPDAGTILVDGREVRFQSPHHARRAGLSMIFQEHTLAPHLTVAENIFLGVEPLRGPALLDRAALERKAREVLQAHSFQLAPSDRVMGLSRARKQLVEIARALVGATRVVVLDEPTAMLSEAESARLFQIIGDLRNRGLGIVYISHRLEELGRIADRITILRDGLRVYTGAFKALDPGDIIRHMVGREIHELYPERGLPGSGPALEVRGLSLAGKYQNVSFTLHDGEILGVAGLVGAGRTDLARGLFGIEPPSSGSVFLRGHPVKIHSPREAIRLGLAYLTEDRKTTSLFPQLSLVHNISMPALGHVSHGPLLDLAEETRKCRELLERLRIRARSERMPVHRLSGGNQQKILIARWLFAGSSILILDEPTQGVDLAARVEIYRLMQEILAAGGSILMISSDLPELLGMSHRVLVMRRGELVAELPAAEASQECIMRHAALIA